MTANAYHGAKFYPKEGANKQVISSQADSLIKISRIWADFFPANTSNQPIEAIFSTISGVISGFY
ncbi:hypothetical protein Q5439_26130 [Escherichia coli]|nr:hypothetical protein [Escherichia coli]MED8181434.1 hypothetical protein [Escherichia coli]MED8581093.1 hypothetical protein [Escherichia coli]MED8674910.1 hypothetical protein [Escherichia coli]MED8679276.1 hypothetical protein [Escherichia coli]